MRNGFFDGTHAELPAKSNWLTGYSGTPGSFSEAASMQYIEEAGIGNAELKPMLTVENVLAALEKGELDLAVFPVGNSSIVAIREVLDAMSQHNFVIRDTFKIPVVHNLLTLHEKGPIRVIVSQQPALDQCAGTIRTRWSRAVLRPHEDTAQAAADLAAGKFNADFAVIASAKAARIHGLSIRQAAIQDSPTNETHFVAATRRV